MASVPCYVDTAFMREETLVFDAHLHLPKFSDPTVWLCGFVVSMFADVLWL